MFLCVLINTIFLFKALRTDTLVIKLRFCNDVSSYQPVFFNHGHRLFKQVNNPPTTFAIEVNVRRGVAIIADLMVINGDHLRHIMLGKETKCIVYSRQTQTRNLRAKSFVHIFNRRMGMMRHDVFAYCQSRLGWLNPVRPQYFFCVDSILHALLFSSAKIIIVFIITKCFCNYFK